MGQFLDPLTGRTPEKKLSNRELTRAIRMALAAEEEAIHHYETLVDSTDNEKAKEILQDIADEEKIHVGELQALLNELSPGEEDFLADGASEVKALGEGIISFSEFLTKNS